jgi:hypothetical protein
MSVEVGGEGADLLQVAKVALEQDDAAEPLAEQASEIVRQFGPFETKAQQG